MLELALHLEAVRQVQCRGGVRGTRTPPRLSPLESPPQFHHNTTTATTADRLPGMRDRLGQRGTRRRTVYNQDRYAGDSSRYHDEKDPFGADADAYSNEQPSKCADDRTNYAGDITGINNGRTGYAGKRAGYAGNGASGHAGDRSENNNDRLGYASKRTTPGGDQAAFGSSRLKTINNLDGQADCRDWPPESEDMYPSGGQTPDFAEHISKNGSKRHSFPQSAHTLDRNGHYSTSVRPVSKIIIGSTKAPKFCHECGSRYPLSSAKFCCECGVRRIIIS